MNVGIIIIFINTADSHKSNNIYIDKNQVLYYSRYIYIK